MESFVSLRRRQQADVVVITRFGPVNGSRISSTDLRIADDSVMLKEFSVRIMRRQTGYSQPCKRLAESYEVETYAYEQR